MAKAKDAFRTISEVAEWLDTPTHVLRFWESKFAQIKPVKGAGGRRYYRPSDMDLLGGIKQLLHEDGLTIKGTQKLLREKGVKYVVTLGASTNVAAAAKPPAKEPEAAKPLPKSEPVAAKTPPNPAPASEPIQDMFPFEDTPPAAEPKPVPAPTPAAAATPKEISLPDFPDEVKFMPGRLIGVTPADLSALHGRAAEIAPLLARLKILREQLRSQ